MAADSGYALAWLNLGDALAEKKDLPAAIDAYNKAVAINPNYSLAWHNLGVALRANRDLPGAIDASKKAVALNPKYVAAWNNLGYALFGQKDLAAAIYAYKKSLNADAKQPVIWNNLGVAHRDQADFSTAIDAYKKALDINPKYALAQTNLDRAQQLLALEKRLPGVLQGDPATAADLLAMADLCQRYKKRYGDAAELYAKAFAADPKAADALVKAIAPSPRNAPPWPPPARALAPTNSKPRSRLACASKRSIGSRRTWRHGPRCWRRTQ